MLMCNDNHLYFQALEAEGINPEEYTFTPSVEVKTESLVKDTGKNIN